MTQRGFFWSRLKIRQKIIGGFLGIIILFNFNSIYSIYSLYQSSSTTENASEVVAPSLAVLSEFRLLLTQSKMNSTNLVYRPQDKSKEDIEELTNIHNDYPQFKDRIIRIKNKWSSQEQIDVIDSILYKFDNVIKHQKELMKDIISRSQVDKANMNGEEVYFLEYEILNPSKELINKIDKLYIQKQKESSTSQSQLLLAFQSMITVNIILGIVLMGIGVGLALGISGAITKPIKYINNVFIKLATGELPEKENRKFFNDEIGQMAQSVTSLVTALRSTSEFAESIGNGDYDASYKPLSEKDVLGNALMEMRSKLKSEAEKDQRRNWQNEGIAMFGELLRKYNNNIKELSEKVVSQLVKYVNANQGGLFILDENTEEGGEPFLYLAAAYAWDKIKFLDQRVYKNDGLVGQAWQEQQSIELTEVPDDFVEITSGLGKSNPSSILIVPLKINEEVFGVVELASFKNFEDFEKEFVEKVAESIASTIASLRINERTQALLKESGMIRDSTEVKNEQERVVLPVNPTPDTRPKEVLEQSLRDLVENTSLIIETDELFRIIDTNKLTQNTLKYSQEDLRGMTLEGIFDSYQKLEGIMLEVKEGGRWTGLAYLKDQENNRLRMHVAVISVKDSNGKLEKYILVLQDINTVALENV